MTTNRRERQITPRVCPRSDWSDELLGKKERFNHQATERSRGCGHVKSKWNGRFIHSLDTFHLNVLFHVRFYKHSPHWIWTTDYQVWKSPHRVTLIRRASSHICTVTCFRIFACTSKNDPTMQSFSGKKKNRVRVSAASTRNDHGVWRDGVPESRRKPFPQPSLHVASKTAIHRPD